MKSKLFFLCFLCCFSPLIRAQHPLNMEKFADSLYQILKKAPNDSVKAATYFNLVAYWTPQDSLKARECMKKGLQFSGQNTFLNGTYYAKLGYLYYFHQDTENSKKNYLKADSLLQKVQHIMAYKMLADIWNNIGVIDQINGDDDAYVVSILNKAIPYAERAGDPNRVASLYISLGVGFMNLEQYSKAIPYFRKAEHILSKDKTQEFRLISMYNRAAEAYLLMDELPQAKEIIEKARSIFNANPDAEQMSLFYMVEGIYYRKVKQYNKAIAAFNLGLTKVKGPNKAYHAHELKINKLETLLEQQNYKEALTLAKSMESDTLLMEIEENRAMVYHSLSQIYRANNQMGLAYSYLKHYSDLKTKIHNEDLKEQINRLETKFNSQAKEKELVNLKNQQKEVHLKLKNSRLYMALAMAGMIIFLLLALLIFGYYRNNKKTLQQNDIIHKQKIADAEKEKQLSVTKAILEGQEKERERVAKDLHDGLGGMLAGISIKFSAWEAKYLKEEGRADFERNKQQLDGAIAELRSISRNLMPESLLKYGLEVALNDLCEFYESPKLSIDFQWYDISDKMKIGVQLNIYRIVQELLSNAVKHSQASQILVQCSQNEDRFYITVEDNGKGYNSSAENSTKGMGLNNVTNRVAFLNGKIEICSTTEEGTTVNIEIDLNILKNA